MVGPSYFKLMVLRRMLLLNDGRDKVLKCVQYGSKAILYLKLVEKIGASALSMGVKLHPLLQSPSGGKEGQAAILPRMEKLVSHMSMTRKIIRLAHFLEPMDALSSFLYDSEQMALVLPWLRAKQPATLTSRVLAFGTLVGSIIGIINDLSDDVICLAKMGVLDKSWTKACTPLSDQLWFASIFIDAHEILQDFVVLKAKLETMRRSKTEKMDEMAAKKLETEEKKVMDKLHMHRISIGKLSMDFVFCAIDVFALGDRGLDDGWQVFTGLAAAILGTTKLYIKSSK
ncbi:hypothetical protein HDU67_009868 [Dinochytrium kinnereticum]|nr:hypothetical protein HDU67_009868 [Dinochytrium kinnereticum]